MVKVCGRDLQTFTLWHHLVLSAINSPIAIGGQFISAADLLVAVRVCQLKYGDANIKPGLKDILWKFKLRKNPDKLRKELETFYEWMNRQSSPPKFYRGGNTGGISKGIESGPRCLGLACSLMYRGGIPEEDAWNSNLGRAMWLDAQFAQLEGIELRFLDDEDLDENPLDLSTLTDDQAMTMFKKDLPPELAESTFDHWMKNIKKKGGDR